MDFQSAMETFAEAWVAANTQTPLTEAAEAQALALTRSTTEVLPTPHEILTDKDSELEGDSSTRTVTTLGRSTLHSEHHLSKTTSRSNTAKSIPVHCIVEQVPSLHSCEQSGDSHPTVELDSFAIIPSQTLFSELVRAALFKLGYASSDIIGAKGAIQIKNWKPLSFETITDDSNATVGEILGELTTVAALRIRLYSRPKISSANDVKEKLLQLLLTQSQSLLVSAGCPIDETLLTLICKGSNLCEIPEETRRRFDQWYIQQVLQHRQLSPTSSSHQTDSVIGSGGGGGGNGNVNHTVNHHHHGSGGGGSGSGSGTASDLNSMAVAAIVGGGGVHRTRMRTSFDPELELPKLHRWFGENQHPTRLQIQQYVRELNALESRKGRKPLDVNNVVYWFKNARAAYKRAEQRQSNGGGGGSCGPCHSPCHDSTSNDHPSRETSSPMGEVEGSSSAAFEGSRATSAPLDANGVQSGGASRSSKSTKVKSEGGDHHHHHPTSEAMDLSMAHRDAEPRLSNGHWKSKDGAVDVGGEGGPLLTTVATNVKKEPLENTASSDETDVDEEDEDEEEEAEEETEVVDDDGYDQALASQQRRPEEGSGTRKSGTGSPASSASSSSSNHSIGNSRTSHQRSPSSASPPSSSSHQHQQSGHGHHHHHHHHHHSSSHSTSSHPHFPPAMLGYMAGFMPTAMAAALDERRKRNRTFIDPVTEVPRLEQWFAFNTHPPHSLILKYTDELNQMTYRQKFPKLEPKNVQFWFKNRRAKCKRLRLSVNLVASPTSTAAAASW